MKSLLISVTASLLLPATTPVNAGEPYWVNIAQLYGSDTDVGDRFGEVISVDGDTLVAAAWRKSPGAVYVFERLPEAPTRWQEVKKLTPSFPGNNFGISVSVSADTIAVRAHPDQATPVTYLFERDAGGAGQWGEVGHFVFEYQGPVGVDRNTLTLGDVFADVGRREDAGAVRVLIRDADDPFVWYPLTTLTTSDPRAQDHFGDAVALSGNRMLIGAPSVQDLGFDSGAAYVFELDQSGAWTETVKLLASDGTDFAGFGSRVGLDATTAIVGTNADAGDHAAYIFERDSLGNWTQAKKLQPSDGAPTDNFGSAVAIAGAVAAVGSWNHDLPDVDAGGASYIFERNEGGPDAWGEIAKITAPEPQHLDQFAWRVALDGNTLAVSAHNDDDRGTAAGTVYLFARTAPLLSVTGYCPGELVLSVIGTTPSDRLLVLASQALGQTSIPAGPCAGTKLNLDHPALLFSGASTSGGDATFTRVAPAPACGLYLQALDVRTCATSDVTQVP